MKYTAEEMRARFEAWAEENGYDVLRIEPNYNDGFTAAAWHGYQAAYAERIKADEGAVTDVIVEAARKAYRSVETRELCPVCGGTGRKHDNFTQCEHCEGSMWTNMADAPDPMRAALLAVWPVAPQTEVVVTRDAAGRIVAVTEQDQEHRVVRVIAEAGDEPVTQGEAATVVDLHDRIEFALRDAGFGLDEASTLAERATAEPATHGESGVIRNVGDSRFELWFSEYVVGQNGAKQQARDAYGAGLAEQAERLAAQPAQWVDVIPEGCIAVPRSLVERWANVDAFNAPVGAAMELRVIAGEMLMHAAALQEKGNG